MGTDKFEPRIITPEMALLGYNNEGRGDLQGYTSDKAKHEATCPYRTDKVGFCRCRIGLWRDAPPAPVEPKLRHKTSAERKAEPIHSGVMLYFPDALAAVARVSKAGNDKHNPGEPLHWARNKSTDQMDCLTRHSLTLELLDAETGETEAAAMVWRGLAQLQLIEERRLKAAGVMPYSGIVP